MKQPKKDFENQRRVAYERGWKDSLTAYFAISEQPWDDKYDYLRGWWACADYRRQKEVAPPAAFQSEALKGASAEASREQAPFLEAVVALRSSAPPADVTRALADAVDFYEREFYPLSNFSAFQINWKAYLFPTAEHAYQWEKFAVYDPERATVILRAKSAHDAFKKAEEWRNYRKPNWDQIKVQTMLEIIRAKTEQHEYVRRKLLETGNRPLIECSWRDDFWGWGPNRDGQNMLGKLWMKIRSEIRAALAAADPQPVDGEIE